MNIRSLVLLVFLFALVIPLCVRADDACTPQMSRELVDADMSFKDWQAFYDFYAKYRSCGDDGAPAEYYSDRVVMFLTKHWGQLDKLDALSHAHPDFQTFVLKHLDELMSPDDESQIRSLATTQCPPEQGKLCHTILKVLDELDAQVKTEKANNS